MTQITSSYSGQLRCASVHGPSGSALETDAPTDNQGKGERFSPTDLVATALNTCILTIMGIVAERDWDLKGARPGGESHDPRSARKIAKLEVWIELPAHLDAKARKILQKAGENCPVKVSLEGLFRWSSLELSTCLGSQNRSLKHRERRTGLRTASRSPAHHPTARGNSEHALLRPKHRHARGIGGLAGEQLALLALQLHDRQPQRSTPIYC